MIKTLTSLSFCTSTKTSQKFKSLLLNMDCSALFSMHTVLACLRARKSLMCLRVRAWKPCGNAICSQGLEMLGRGQSLHLFDL